MMMEFVIFAWIGAIIMFTFTVSPTVFEVLESDDAGRFLRAYFPRLFRIEIGVGAAVVALSLYALTTSDTSTWIGVLIGVVVSSLAGVNLLKVMPAVNVVADAMAHSPDPETKKRFGLLHGLSVGLFGVNALMLIGFVVLV
jgi:hypothetical protein